MCPNPFYGGSPSPSFVNYNTLMHKRILESKRADSTADISYIILFSAQGRYPGLTDREDDERYQLDATIMIYYHK